METKTEHTEKSENVGDEKNTSLTQTSEVSEVVNNDYPYDVVFLNPFELRSTVANTNLYHDSHVTDDLEYSIRKAGRILNPIVVNENYEILSGARRTQAARKMNLTTIPAYIVNSNSINYSVELHANINRKKSYEVIMREAEVMEMELLTEKANTSVRSMIIKYPNGASTNKEKSHFWNVNKFIANHYGIGETYLKYLKTIKRNNPYLISDIDFGRISVEKAYKLSMKKGNKPRKLFEEELCFCTACNRTYKKKVAFMDEDAAPISTVPTIRYIKFGQIYDVLLYKNKLSKTDIEGERIHGLEDHFSGRLAPEEIAPKPKWIVGDESLKPNNESLMIENTEINTTSHE